MNLPLPTYEGGVDGKAPGVCVGAQGAPGATLCVGSVGFGPAWHDDEPSLRQMYEQACQSIVRLEEQKADALEVMAEILFWIEDDLRGEVDSSYRAAVEKAQKLTEGLR